METPRNTPSWEDVINSMENLDPALKSGYLSKVKNADKFIPPNIGKFKAEDILEIEKVIGKIDEEVARGVPSYAYFNKLLRKIQVLIAESFPDFFHQLRPEVQKQLLYAKVAMPTENDVEHEVFDVMNSGSALRGSFTFDQKVEDILQYNELSKNLGEVYSAYKEFFRGRKRAA